MSEVILDTITGKSTATTITIGSTPVVSASANSMTIRGEGSAQTSIQQGLVKAWVFSGDDASLTNAFNVASGTDNSTGNYTFTYTSNQANANPSAAASVTDNSDRNATVYSTSTTAFTTEVFVQNGSESDTRNRTIICGDLA